MLTGRGQVSDDRKHLTGLEVDKLLAVTFVAIVQGEDHG